MVLELGIMIDDVDRIDREVARCTERQEKRKTQKKLRKRNEVFR